MSDKPDNQIVQDLLGIRMGEWTGAHDIFRIIDSFYWGTYKVWPNHGKRPFLRPSTAPNIIDHAVDNQLAFKPHMTVISSGESEDDKKENTLCENFLSAAFQDASLQEPSLPWKMMQRYGTAYGYFVCDGPRLDFSTRPDEPERGAGEKEARFKELVASYDFKLASWSPIRISAPHPARVLLNPLEKRPAVAIKKITYYASELEKLSLKKVKSGKSQFPWLWKRNAKADEKIPGIEYWDDDWHGVFINAGNEIFPVEANTWGFAPFGHAFSGWGMEKTDQNEPIAQSLAIGVLHHVRDSLLAQAQQFSSEQNILINKAWALIGTQLAAEELAAKMARGDIIGEIKREDIFEVDTKDVHPWMFQLGDEIARDIEAGTYAKAIRGAKESGVVTVGQQVILTNAAQRRFFSLQEQMDQTGTTVANRILRLVEVYGSALTIGGHTLKPKDVVGKSARVRFELKDPIMQLQLEQNEMSKYDRKLSSKATFWEVTGLEDPSRERERLMDDLLFEHPGIIEEAVMERAKVQGLDQLLIRFKERQQQEQAGGLVGPDGKTPIRSAALRQPMGESGVAKPGQVKMGALDERL